MTDEMTTGAVLARTLFHQRHVDAGARMVEFGGWDMPVQYPSGIVEEHLATRRHAGLFDVSHMGRFVIGGPGAVPFLQFALTNNCAGLDVGEAQYTIIPTATGGAVDDAYLYRFVEDEHLLVVNASNRQKDWDHFQAILAAAGGGGPDTAGGVAAGGPVPDFGRVRLEDKSEDIVMLSLQGPESRAIVESLLEGGQLPDPWRNQLSTVHIAGADVWVGRTGYTGEPVCFEFFIPREHGLTMWDTLVAAGAVPIGLGARDTLRLEGALPLYGHELGEDPAGNEIPVFAIPLAKLAVSFSAVKGDFVGGAALAKQRAAYTRIVHRDYSLIADLPRMIMPVALSGRGVARQGSEVFRGAGNQAADCLPAAEAAAVTARGTAGEPVGWVTSGTMVPAWRVEGEGLKQHIVDEKELRPIALALVSSDVIAEDRVEVDIRGKRVDGVVVDWHLRSDAPPYARPIFLGRTCEEKQAPTADIPAKVAQLLGSAADNHEWRQRRAINLIPSEMTASPMVRLLSISDPAFRYAEHRKAEAFYDAEVFYYQGTDFIDEVERLLVHELRTYLGCPEVETRVISGQMANACVFSAMVEYLNRADPKSEPRRIRQVMNNHIVKGGHLSAQPMGALRDFVARDPKTDLPAVENFPMLPDNPFKMDVEETKRLLLKVRPELVIFGKSMVIHKEPVAEIRAFIDEQGLDAVVMYDMAHVLGLVGPHFQEPFKEGADLVTGSTHKTFFGPQRGIVGCAFREPEERYDLWEAIQRRAFPGSVSNHHLGTLLGLLMASYEMNHFKDAYQQAVIANAKAFARALAHAGLHVAGDPAIDYTETHQAIVRVGYGDGPEIARRLEDNDIVCNYQAAPDEEGFSAAGALRLGVSEMTRFGMGPDDFAQLAELMKAVIVDGTTVRDKVNALRSRFVDLQYCFSTQQYRAELDRLSTLL
jgi:aminomethyltransferase